MSEENKKDEEELDESEEELDESEEELDEESDEESDESKGSNIDALAGLAGAAAASSLANRGNKKPVKGKVTAKSKKGSKTVSKPAPSISKDGSVDVNAKIDEIQKLTDKNTVWTVAGYSFTPAKLMILGTLLSTALGGLYGSFEVYKDYQSMKKQITNYVAPDLSVFDKRLEIVAEKAEKSVQYTQDIKNDLKQDIRRLEGTVEQVERSSKQSQRETDISVKEVQSELRQTRKELDVAIKDINSNVDKKIQRALDNPLAGK